MIFYIIALACAGFALLTLSLGMVHTKKWDKVCIAFVFAAAFCVGFQYKINYDDLQESCANICGQGAVLECQQKKITCNIGNGRTLTMKIRVE